MWCNRGGKKETEPSLEKQVQKSIVPLKSDDMNLHYNIIGTLKDSFGGLSKKEQFDFFARTTEKIRELNKEHWGNLSCAKRFLCEIWSVEFSTSNEKYKMYYKGDTDIYMGEESTLVIGINLSTILRGFLLKIKMQLLILIQAKLIHL